MTGTIKAVITGTGTALYGYGLFKTATAVSVALRDVIRCEAQILTIHREINDWTAQMDPNFKPHATHLNALHERLRLWQARANAFDKRLQRAER
jgi:hypothetical protein